jgi:hypothetical protein
MRMRTDKIIADGTIDEIDSFIEDFKKDFEFTIIDDDTCIESNKRLVIVELVNGQSLVINNKQSDIDISKVADEVVKLLTKRVERKFNK